MTKTKCHSPILTHLHMDRCSCFPSSNAFSTWKCFTPTIWSWSVQWWRYKGFNALLRCLMQQYLQRENHLRRKHSTHVFDTCALNIKSIWKAEGKRNNIVLRNCLGMFNTFIFVPILCLSNHPAQQLSILYLLYMCPIGPYNPSSSNLFG